MRLLCPITHIFVMLLYILALLRIARRIFIQYLRLRTLHLARLWFILLALLDGRFFLGQLAGRSRELTLVGRRLGLVRGGGAVFIGRG